MRFLELFAGAGGLSMGLEAAGMACVAHAEIEPHARAVLRYAWRDVPLYGDVSQLNGADLMAAHPFDVLTGGSPCQDLSVAGKRAGLAGSRSSLFHVQHRLWMESGAPYLLWENVAGAFSSNGGADFATVLSTLVGAAVPVPADGWRRGGVASGPDAVAAWRVLDLQYVAGRDRAAPPQRRVRVFVLAARSGGVDPAEVLALGSGVCGHPAPRRRAGEGTPGDPAGGVRGGGAIGIKGSVIGRSDDAGSQRSMTKDEAMFCLQTHEVHGVFAWDDECNAADVMGTLIKPPEAGGHRGRAGVLAPEAVVMPTLTAANDPSRSPQSSEVTAQVAAILSATAPEAVPVVDKQSGQVDHGVTPTLKTDLAHQMGPVVTQEGTGPLSRSQVPAVVPPSVTTYSTPAIGDIREDDVASTVTAHTGGGGETQNPAFVVVASGQVSNVTNPTFDGAPSLTCLHEAPIVVGTLDAHDAVKWGSHQWVDQGKAMLTGGRPRRLTPLECERLMAWPDGHTAVGIDEQGREYRLSDTARYRLCGNGVGSTCTEWIGRRLVALEAMATAAERQGAA